MTPTKERGSITLIKQETEENKKSYHGVALFIFFCFLARTYTHIQSCTNGE